MHLHLLEIYRGPESGVRTPNIFPIIGSHLKNLFSSWRAIIWNQATANIGCVGWLEFQGLEWGKLSLCGWMCVSAWIENHIAEILQVPGFEQPQWAVDSRSWNMEMWGVYWRQKVIVWEAVMIYVLHCGHCVWPSTSMLSTRTHTPLIHMIKLFPARRYTLVESAYFFIL